MPCVHTPKNIIGVVLAGGKSSRMGRDKALLPFKNLRFVDHMVGLFKGCGIAETVISGKVDGHLCIEDIVPHCGPVGGIYSVLNGFTAHQGPFVFVPVDMPLLTPQLLNNLLTSKQESTATHFQGYPLPFVINKPAIARAVLAKQVAKTSIGGSIKAFLNALSAEALPITESAEKHFANCNTPQDLLSLSS